MGVKTLLLLLGVSCLSGCIATAHFYPVAGPLAAQTPLSVLSATFTGALNSGTISMRLRNGKVSAGRWVRIKADANAPAGAGMPAAWDLVYGQGYYVSHVMGTRLYAKVEVPGEQGSNYSVEFYRAQGGLEKHIRLFGVAKDTAGNLYKVIFN